MIIYTALGTAFECEAASSIQTPPRLYFHLVNTSMNVVQSAFQNPSQLPVQGYDGFTVLQSISSEGEDRVKVSLKKPGT